MHTWILIFDISSSYLRPYKAKNQDFLVPSGLFATCWNTQSSSLLPSLLPSTTVGREECSNMWQTYLEQVFIFSWRLMRVIIKIEVREITFGHAVITWNFFLIFYCCKIRSFGPIKVRFEGKKLKDVADDCTFVCYFNSWYRAHARLWPPKTAYQWGFGGQNEV